MGVHMPRIEREVMENRELSWLRFNERIVDEADDPANPLLERAKFLAIVTSNMDEFLQVQGVSERKAVRFGKKFIGAIRKFEGLSATMPQGTTYKETLILHNAGVPLGEMAQIKGVTVDTIRSHIARLIDEDMISTFGNYITRAEYEAITSAIAAGGAETEKELRERYPQATINLAKSILAYYQRNKV